MREWWIGGSLVYTGLVEKGRLVQAMRRFMVIRQKVIPTRGLLHWSWRE